jgi:oligopeptidase A
MTNPLLNPALRTQHIDFPAIKPAHFKDAFDVLLPKLVDEHEAWVTTAPLTFQGMFVDGDVGPQLGAVAGLLSHLTSVVDTPELRAIYEDAMPRISQLQQEQSLDVRGWQKVKDYAATEDYAALSPLYKKLVNEILKSYEDGGIHLPDDKKARLADISARLAELSHEFECNLSDFTSEAVLAFSKEELAGVPARTLQNATELPDGRLEISMVAGGFGDVADYCEVESTRKAVYEYQLARGVEDHRDNRPLMAEILVLRKELATLLGYANYAAMSVEDDMAATPQAALDFTKRLAELALPKARAEVAEIDAFGAELLGRPVEFWDLAFIVEKYQQARYQVDTEALRAYFPVGQVVHGLFQLIERLYDIVFEADTSIPTWHPDVTAWRVVDKTNGTVRGTLYLDLFKRKHKDAGAWMNPAANRHQAHGEHRLPVVYIVCNTPKDAGRAPTFTFDDVITLFHEMGHALHNLLTDVDEEFFSGLSQVQHDAVELPSQFMENFCWDYDVLRSLSAHIDTSEALPESVFAKLHATKLFLAASRMLRTARYALLDMELHVADNPDPAALEVSVISDWSVRERDPRAQVLPSFSHIFAGGYAAGYYAYQWAEMLSADAFAALTEAGQTLAEVRSRALDFRKHVLASGGVDSMAVNFERFRGRAPDVRHLLEAYGVLAPEGNTP